MVGNEETTPTRRSVLRATATLLGTGAGLAGTGAATQDDPYSGFVCGPEPAEGETFTVEPRCDDDCAVIRATGLTPNCSGGNENIYVNLHGTDPTIWVTPTDRRTGSIRPGTYRVVETKQCGGDAPTCDDDVLFRVRFREKGENLVD